MTYIFLVRTAALRTAVSLAAALSAFALRTPKALSSVDIISGDQSLDPRVRFSFGCQFYVRFKCAIGAYVLSLYDSKYV